jgi:hypothetical protein
MCLAYIIYFHLSSEARRANAMLRASNLDDPLAVIFTPDGDESPLFPRDLRTLFNYDRKFYL